MAFIVLQPWSLTNDSDRYRVVDSTDYVRFINGAAKTYAFLAFDTYKEAEAKRDEMNSQD